MVPVWARSVQNWSHKQPPGNRQATARQPPGTAREPPCVQIWSHFGPDFVPIASTRGGSNQPPNNHQETQTKIIRAFCPMRAGLPTNLALLCFALHNFALNRFAWHCNVLVHTAFLCTVHHFIALLCFASFCTLCYALLYFCVAASCFGLDGLGVSRLKSELFRIWIRRTGFGQTCCEIINGVKII